MASRNFDEEFDHESEDGHEFTLGGHVFRTAPVAPPGAFLAGGRGLVAAVRFLRRVVRPEDRVALERVIEMPDVTATLLDNAPDLLQAAKLVLAAEDVEIREAALKTLQEVVDRASEVSDSTGPLVSAYELDQVADWLMEVTIGRPTQPPSPSGNGGGRTSAGSKGASKRPAAVGKS